MGSSEFLFFSSLTGGGGGRVLEDALGFSKLALEGLDFSKQGFHQKRLWFTILAGVSLLRWLLLLLRRGEGGGLVWVQMAHF